MRLTSKGRYAVRAVLDLAFNSKGEPVRLQEISTRQAISLHYLEQLFRKLRTGKIVKSVRGPGGGYVLSRSMDDIFMKEILLSVGENINPARDIDGTPSSGVDLEYTKKEAPHVVVDENNAVTIDTPELKATKDYFENLGSIMMDYLTTTSVGDLYRRSKTSQADQFNTLSSSPYVDWRDFSN